MLIKSIAQAIPTYIMSCFRMPKTLCDDLHSMMAQFWWGSSETKRKIHWKKWSHLCLPKELGGLNFRDLETFNKALLAKQVWRLFTNPNLLVSRVIKGRYAHQDSLLSAPIKTNCFVFWRGFVWARELLLSGLRRQIGNGKSTYFFKDPWIPKEVTFKPIKAMRAWIQEDARVSEFITQSMGWNSEKLREVVIEEDANIIKTIPIRAADEDDALI